MLHSIILALLYVGDGLSVRDEFAEEFVGWYSMALPSGERAEVIAVVEDGIASIGMGSQIDRVFEWRSRRWVANLALDRHDDLVILVRHDQNRSRILLTKIGAPWNILSGVFSRASFADPPNSP